MREKRTEDVIHISRELWERMRNSVKRIIYPNVKIIDEEVSKKDEHNR